MADQGAKGAANIEKLITMYGSNGYSVGDSLTWADLLIFEIASSLSFDKPEIRYKKLLSSQPELFQKVPQKYLASILGISPESLSRIKARKT